MTETKFPSFKSSKVCFNLTFVHAPVSTRVLRCVVDEKCNLVYVNTVPSAGIIAEKIIILTG